jgi:alpha-galactosidase
MTLAVPNYLVDLHWRGILVGIALLGLAVPLGAVDEPKLPPVRYLAEQKQWVLETRQSSYILGVSKNNELLNVYWGKRLGRDQDLISISRQEDFAFESVEGLSTEEYPGWGGMRYSEPCLKVTRADGVRDLVLRYISHRIQGDSLEIQLRDIQYELEVTLRYKVYPETDIVGKQTEIQNKTNQTFVLESAQSGVWFVPRGDGYRLSYLTGRWGGETHLIREPIHPGKKLLESRRGNTSHQVNPWFAIDEGGSADEDHGRIWFGALAWSGNWKLVVEQTPNQQVRVVGGFNDFDFGYSLKPGETLQTPAFYGGFTNRGFGEASQLMHRFQQREILPDRNGPKLRPVLYNSWEATLFNVNEEGQRKLAEKAARIGVELFVMDDGWFGARDDDRAGLGDWTVNPKKFPNGLRSLIDSVNSLGMRFGLWVEPEMVNPNSDLYRQHPDWAIHFQDRPRTEGRNQLILNMASDEVKEHIFGVLDKLLNENNISFLKWDMNRHFSEPGWPQVPVPEQKKIWVKYVTNVYEIIDRLRAKHPNVEVESCSGGGGRVDLGILRRVDQVWTSDNTEAFDRLRIQEGFSFAYTPKVMMDWVTDVPNMNGRTTPLKYRFLVAMQGSLGIGANLNHWSTDDFALAKRMVDYYKVVRQTVQQGRLFRLYSPREENLTANEYVAEDGKQVALFAFLHSQQFLRPAPTLYVKGLEEAAVYRVKAFDDKLIEKQETLSGAYLANHGLTVKLSGDFDSTSVLLEKVE